MFEYCVVCLNVYFFIKLEVYERIRGGSFLKGKVKFFSNRNWKKKERDFYFLSEYC